MLLIKGSTPPAKFSPFLCNLRVNLPKMEQLSFIKFIVKDSQQFKNLHFSAKYPVAFNTKSL